MYQLRVVALHPIFSSCQCEMAIRKFFFVFSIHIPIPPVEIPLETSTDVNGGNTDFVDAGTIDNPPYSSVRIISVKIWPLSG